MNRNEGTFSMSLRTLKAVGVCAVVLFLGSKSAFAHGDETPAIEAGKATEGTIKAATQPPIDTGDNAWMLVSCALVLFMTAPGLAMFYSGLVRKKNVLGVMMQCLFLMGMMTVLWGVCGYTLAFGGTGDKEDAGINAWIGNVEFLFMDNVQPTLEKKILRNADGVPVDPHGDLVEEGGKLYYEEALDDKDQPTGEVAWESRYPMEGTIPRLTHMLFQGMFFIITPALICGAFAERMKFSTMVVFSIAWGLLVYCPLCHWVWDGGILAYGSQSALFGGKAGALDFAGGTVVHISSGVSALVCALVIGKRLGFGSEPMPPHNLAFTILGAAMLWVGWFGFNAGSALASNGLAAGAFCATHFAAAAGALSWAGAEWIQRGKPSVLGAASGAVAGLVCITPAAGFVLPMHAIIMGLAAGVVCYYACTLLKRKLGYDDSLDAFGVHGAGGTLGAIMTGVFASTAVAGSPDAVGLVEGGSVIVNQIIATLVTWVFAAAVSFVLLKILDATMGLRVSQEDEIQGLDVSQHGEEGYIFI
jgi:Amt family ammonium transporter